MLFIDDLERLLNVAIVVAVVFAVVAAAAWAIDRHALRVRKWK